MNQHAERIRSELLKALEVTISQIPLARPAQAVPVLKDAVAVLNQLDPQPAAVGAYASYSSTELPAPASRQDVAAAVGHAISALTEPADVPDRWQRAGERDLARKVLKALDIPVDL